MKNITSVIHPYHAALILGISIRTAQTKLCEIKTAYKKTGTHKHISLSEFSKYTGIPMEDILRTLGTCPI